MIRIISKIRKGANDDLIEHVGNKANTKTATHAICTSPQK